MLPEQNDKKLNELVPPMSVSNPAAYKALLDKEIAKNVKVKTALGNKDHKDHTKAKSLYQKFMDKFKKKKDEPKKPEKQSKSDADFYKRQYETMNEAKIQVPGIGMYDEKTLKSKIVKLATNLQKVAKKGDFSKASENGIRALGSMWGAYQDWQRKNESVNEMKFAKKDISKWNKSAGGALKRETPMVLVRGRWYSWEEGDRKSVFVSDKNGKEYEFDYSDVEQIEESVNESKYNVKKAIAIAKKMKGNMTGAVKKIEKIQKGLSKQIEVEDALRTANESVNEDDLGLTYKKGKTVKVKHKTSGKSLIIIDKPNVRKEYEKIGYFAEGKVNESMNSSQAKELLKQLGGGKFVAMTGAKNFSAGKDGLSFKIGRNSKRVNYVRIDLDRGRDLYNMEFLWVSKKGVKIVKKVKGVYVDQLHDTFTKYTGMYTSL